MNKCIRKFVCYLIVGIISINASFNSEARLPKYMAQRAAELLIEKSELLKDDVILVNSDYEALIPIISAAVNEYITEANPNDFSTEILQKIKKTEEETLHQEIKKRFVAALEHAQIVIPSEKTTETLSEAMKHAVITKLISDQAANIVDFLYSTEKRQVFADWMKLIYKELTFAKRTRISLKEASKRWDQLGNYKTLCMQLNELLHLCLPSRGHDYWTKEAWEEIWLDPSFIMYANQHFPCWTGTLTCFMLSGSSIANKALSEGEVVERCKESLSNANSAYKVIGILFALELVDNWDDIKRICEKDEGAPVAPAEWVDPYDCVPVPNTMYEAEEEYKGTCLISTVRNLLCIFCKGDHNLVFPACVKGDVRAYFDRFGSSVKLATVSGITNIDEQNAWTGTLLAIRNLHFPDLKGFVDTIIGLLNELPEVEDLGDKLNKLIRYRAGFVEGIQRVAINAPGTISLAELNNIVTTVFRKLTGHAGLTVESCLCPIEEKRTNTWPVLLLSISDTTVHKKVTIGIGNVGKGQHVEITEISPI